MKRVYALPLIALLAAAPFALAQTNDSAPVSPEYDYEPPMADQPDAGAEGSVDEGAGLIGRGMDMLFRNLMNEMAPEIEGMSQDLAGALSMMGPALSDLSVLVDDIANYQTPERLENGDIVIRRKPGAPPPPAIGEGLRDLGRNAPGSDTDPDEAGPPVDPSQPQIEL
ncbi:hypothetical protein [Paracoccus tegillarcae]|uniref:AAA+ family ATPase n=1 Tax=Paracoccus tegillarcae TaxID=1529068 RepID=A0A2K9EGQ3_9RHOB|nr:hypothetical protein [Paracoccus tegillarcae]AUH34150.1 hypothetical protein CUV01_12760 [Paracoccus tegillarcae]